MATHIHFEGYPDAYEHDHDDDNVDDRPGHPPLEEDDNTVGTAPHAAGDSSPDPDAGLWAFLDGSEDPVPHCGDIRCDLCNPF